MSKIEKNKLILGTVQMGVAYGINNHSGKISMQHSIELLDYAFDHGIELLDSAEAYGNAHEVIGVFHKKHPEKQFKVITKLPHQSNMDIRAKVDDYIEELKVDQLHALLFHSFATYRDHSEHYDVLNTLKLEGKTKFIGVSVYTNEELETVMMNDDIDIIQLPFNLFDNVNLRGDILKKAKAKGKMIHTRSAVLQGLFFKDPNDDMRIVQKLKNELLQISNISKRHHISISQLALSYCLSQPTIDNVLIGVDSIEQLKDNLSAVNYNLDSMVIDDINNIHVQNLDLLNPSLWN